MARYGCYRFFMKIPFAVSALLLTFLIPNFVSANDSFGVPTYKLINENVITCGSFDLSGVPEDSFLVFDYSKEIGIVRGKPWTIIEQGKCYQLDTNDTQVFQVVVRSGSEREMVETAAKQHGTSASFSEVFCDQPELSDSPQPHSCSSIHTIYDTYGVTQGDGYLGLGYQPEYLYSLGIWAPSLFPTKYEFGAFITTAEASFYEFQTTVLTKDLEFQEADALYTRLAEDLNAVLKKCDTRKRLEYRFTPVASVTTGEIGYLGGDMVWRLADGMDFIIKPKYGEPEEELRDSIELVAAMGCADEYRAYLSENAEDFKRIDVLAEGMLERYADSYADIMVHEHEPKELASILRFWEGEEVNIESVTPTTTTEYEAPNPMLQLLSLWNSENPLMKLYYLLPVAAVLGIAVFWLYRRRK